MRGKAFALSFLAFFTVVAISPNLSTFLVSAAKVRTFSGIRWARRHNFVPAHIRCRGVLHPVVMGICMRWKPALMQRRSQAHGLYCVVLPVLLHDTMVILACGTKADTHIGVGCAVGVMLAVEGGEADGLQHAVQLHKPLHGQDFPSWGRLCRRSLPALLPGYLLSLSS